MSAPTFPDHPYSLPQWIPEVVAPGQRVESEEERMRLAIRLAREHVERGTGGPFGAVVCELESGSVVGVGVNLVVPLSMSSAHAEQVAWTVAQQAVGNYDLGDARLPAMGLYTSSQMCVSCWGGVFWSGLARVVSATTGEDVESIAGFDEGPIPDDWEARLRSRGIEVRTALLRAEACAVLRRYVERGGVVYNSRKGQT